MKEAYLYEKMNDSSVRCFLCNHRCLIKEGSRGICQVRENRDGALISLVYGKVIARHVDPIEKKPLFHFLPGTNSYSIATVGCNFKCQVCINWEISQAEKIVGKTYTPEDIIKLANEKNLKIIAYTYSEPTMFFEFAYRVSRIAKS